MIEANKNELFPVTVSLIDDNELGLVSGKEVNYDIRNINDAPLSPPISGSLVESSVEGGIYKKEVSIPKSGSYICYATCSGFVSSTESIIINEENLFELSKRNLPYNTSVIDVVRTTGSGNTTASQMVRNVPINKTDYIVTLIKNDDDLDWSNPVSSGISYAHYLSTEDDLPYMMGGPY